MTLHRRAPDSGPEWLIVLALFAIVIAAYLLLPGCAAVQARTEVDTRLTALNEQVAAIGSTVNKTQQQLTAIGSRVDASIKNFDPLTMYLTVGGLVSIVLADRYLPLLATLWRRPRSPIPDPRSPKGPQ